MGRLKPLFDLSVLRGLSDKNGEDGITSLPLILTPNRRLAAQITSAFDEEQLRSGRGAWSRPPIFPIEEWLADCWRELLLRGNPQAAALTPLSQAQELLIWEQVITGDRDALLLKPQATAKSVQAAYRTLILWETEIGPAFRDHPDCARFARWASLFKKRCRQDGYIDTGSVVAVVAEAFAHGELMAPDTVALFGFQQMPPLYEKLLRATGAKLLQEESKPACGDTRVLACENVEQELWSAASWIKEQLQANPDQRIALVVPDLKQRRTQVERIFSAIFEPQYILPETAPYQAPFNISAGTALSDTPLVYSALTLLKLNHKEMETLEWLMLMRSPFLLDQVALHAELTVAEQELRRRGFPRLSADKLREILSGIAKKGPAVRAWHEALTAVADRPYRNGRVSLDQWVELFRQQLEIFQWPGRRRPDSLEYQQLMRWDRALQDFLSLSELCGEVTLERALTLLNRFIGGIEFQGESSPSPVQILGVLEGAGLRFDALWLLGVNDHNWPPPPSPNPFIPFTVQRSAAMPHASAERELAFTQKLFDDYLRSAGQVVASYSLRDQDQPLLPSRLLDNIEQHDIVQKIAGQTHLYHQLVRQNSELQSIVDLQAPALNQPESSLPGGTQILKNQAACPFKAFALHRLNARPLEEPSNHISPQQRGIMLHRALELLWEKLKGSEGLRTADSSDLKLWLNRAVTSAVLSQSGQRPDLFGETMIKLEISRLQQLITDWLLVEEQREPFSVAATEAAVIIHIADTPLRVRIDRIDRLENGGLLLIDYKTGAGSVGQWQGERPDEPQLPLYCIGLDSAEWGGSVDGIAFARINVDKQGFVGVAQRDDIGRGILTPEHIRNWEMPADWDELGAVWASNLQELMREFLSGYAKVDPKTVAACRYCHLSALCRIDDPRSYAEELP